MAMEKWSHHKVMQNCFRPSPIWFPEVKRQLRSSQIQMPIVSQKKLITSTSSLANRFCKTETIPCTWQMTCSHWEPEFHFHILQSYRHCMIYHQTCAI